MKCSKVIELEEPASRYRVAEQQKMELEAVVRDLTDKVGHRANLNLDLSINSTICREFSAGCSNIDKNSFYNIISFMLYFTV